MPRNIIIKSKFSWKSWSASPRTSSRNASSLASPRATLALRWDVCTARTFRRLPFHVLRRSISGKHTIRSRHTIQNLFFVTNHQFSFKNMCKLKPILERWLDDAERYLNPSSTSMTEQQLESARRRKKRTSIDSTIKGGMLGTFSLYISVSSKHDYKWTPCKRAPYAGA